MNRCAEKAGKTTGRKRALGMLGTSIDVRETERLPWLRV